MAAKLKGNVKPFVTPVVCLAPRALNQYTTLVRVLEPIMSTRLLHTVTLLALAAFSTLALADDPPALVGRVSLAQGQVTISGEVGEESSAALLNWPVTSHRQLTTGRDARAEFRIGSTAVRLDADSALEIIELDDDSLRMHLQYGSASVRVRNPDVLRGFDLSTPQGHVRLQEPGRFRVDAERTQDTTAVNVFEGVASVDGGGMTLTVRAGKRAELVNDDVKTGLAVHDRFDDWAQLRDQQDERSVSARYVTAEMTGYEDLDQNGSWREDADYGPIWMPRSVPVDWAPYRDGRWTWIAPWGWTWVDNAPWGYAPFHYGRWVLVNQRWCWTPGRQVGRPVWAPALVGWVGGVGWSASFASRGGHSMPAQGWYPLTPRDAFVPGYRVSPERLRQINNPSWAERGRGHERDHEHDRDGRRDGLTVVPHEQFGQRGTIVVRNAPKAVVAPLALQHAPVAAPPPPQAAARDPRGDRRFDREREAEVARDGVARGRGPQPGGQPRVLTAPTVVPAPQRPPISSSVQPVITGPAPAAIAPVPRRDGRPVFDDRRDGRQADEDGRHAGRPFEDPRRLQAAPVPQAAAQPVPAAPMMAPAARPAPLHAQPMPVPQAQPQPLHAAPQPQQQQFLHAAPQPQQAAAQPGPQAERGHRPNAVVEERKRGGDNERRESR